MTSIMMVNPFWAQVTDLAQEALANLANADVDPNGSDTVINLDAEVYDRTGWHDNTTNNSRLTVPTGGALIRGIFGFDAASVPNVRSLKNGASFPGRGQKKQGTATRSHAFTALIPVVATDYLEFTCTNDVNVENRSYAGVEAIPPTSKHALVARTSALALTAATNTVVSFDSETADVGGWHDNGTNPSRLTVPSGVTRIRVSAGASFASETNDTRMFIHKNGASMPGRPDARMFSGTGVTYHCCTSAILEVSPGDYFELTVRAENARNLNADDGTWFCIEEILVDPKRALVSTAGQVVVSGIETAAAWANETYDTDAIHDTGSNTSRLTVPSGVTKAKITFGLVTGAATTLTSCRVFKNGASFVGTAFDGLVLNTAANAPIMNGVTPWIDVVAGDYFELMVTTGTGSTTITASDSCWFAIECR